MKASFSFSLLFRIAVILTVFFIGSGSWQNENKRTFFAALANPAHCTEKIMPPAKTEKTGESKIMEPKVQVKTVIHEVIPEKKLVKETGSTQSLRFQIRFPLRLPVANGLALTVGLVQAAYQRRL